jgi:hypothetical protein
VPRTVSASAIVSPFDPVMWERRWTSSVFGFEYQIEIYVPQPKRIYGYYVLPYILGDRFVARLDLKADRKTKTLLVHGAFLESGADQKRVVAGLAEELRSMARWLELDSIAVGAKGNLAKTLARALKARS